MYADLIGFFKKNDIEFLENANIAPLNSLELAGVARYVVFPDKIETFCEVLHFLYNNKIKFFVIGCATNLVFPEYYDGVIVSSERLNDISVEQDSMVALCGARVTDCAIVAMSHSLGGMEFLCGIPGSVGGAVYMNASAFDESVSNIVCESLVFDLNRNERLLIKNTEHEFDAKRSIFNEHNNLILLYTKFLLRKSTKEEIRSKMLRYSLKRISTQPLELGNAGSTFKRPYGAYASKLIDDAGMKGFKIGD